MILIQKWATFTEKEERKGNLFNSCCFCIWVAVSYFFLFLFHIFILLFLNNFYLSWKIFIPFFLFRIGASKRKAITAIGPQGLKCIIREKKFHTTNSTKFNKICAPNTLRVCLLAPWLFAIDMCFRSIHFGAF